MKITLLTILTMISFALHAQNTLVPGKSAFEKKWIKSDTYQMTWYAMRDTAKFEIAEVFTTIQTDKKYISIITEVKMKSSKGSWIDTTIAKIATLEPVRHSSYNLQRDMVLDYGKTVTGFYHDKIKKQTSLIRDTISAEYFDSNIYPALIAWLPLEEKYTREISIYDYNPSGKMGIIKAFVKNVSSGTYQTSAGLEPVWIVTVADEISGIENAMIYYFAKSDRKLWKQEINANGRKMMMVRKD